MQQINQKDGGDGINRPPDALLRAESHRPHAWRFRSLRNGLNRRGRRASMRSFKVRTVQQTENAWLHPRTQAAPGRPLKDANKVWETAADVLLAWRLWPITQRVLAVSLNQPVIGNTWWAFKTELSPERRKALLLWLNSSLSLLAFFGSRVATRSAWMQMKKPAWSAMPVLNVRVLSAAQVSGLAAAYDALCDRELQAVAQLNIDPVRRAMDEALSAALGLPDLAPLREMLAREPGLTGKSAVGRPTDHR